MNTTTASSSSSRATRNAAARLVPLDPPHNILPNSLHQIGSSFNYFAGLFISLKNRTIGIGAHYFNFRILLFQKSAGAGDGASGSYSGNKVGNPTFGLVPNFRT